MEYTTLGRTELRVSVVGLGCGGPSCLGLRRGATEDEAIAVVECALDLGVNLIDTARGYHTEEVVGRAVAGRRAGVVLSTKSRVEDRSGPLSAKSLAQRLEQSLKHLRTDCVDLYFLHGVLPGEYEHCVKELVPELFRLREQGKLRYLGISERFQEDPQHQMLQRALQNDCWDSVMVGFNSLSPSARESIFPRTRAGGVGTLIMFAARHLFEREAQSSAEIADAAYGFCRREPGADVILTGTGSVEHLKQNCESILRAPLPPQVVPA